MIRPLALIALTALTASAHASDCADAQTQQQLNQCFQQAYAQADARLNAQFEQILGRLQEDVVATRDLRRAQRAWLAYRDAECRFASPVQGSAAGMVLTQCLARLTRQRSDDFQRYLQCKEGDLSCRLPRQRSNSLEPGNGQGQGQGQTPAKRPGSAATPPGK